MEPRGSHRPFARGRRRTIRVAAVSKAADGRSSIHCRADGVGWEGWVSLGLYPVTVAGKITQLERQRSTGVVTVDPDTTVSACLEAWL
ncbi:MAG TPA: hypothetical protein VHI14_03710, partial [Jatrophihabitantaceae bacterium]|nr:hypothetical protein [Jatrophihabitantaceae bacterium]